MVFSQPKICHSRKGEIPVINGLVRRLRSDNA